MPRPLLTLAVPLYRSSVFFRNITEQLDKLIAADHEVIISDRHGLDDTIDRLEAYYAHDERFRFIRLYDQANWVHHHNDLIKAAKGEYFMWMSHDDKYQPNYCTQLLAILMADPEAILAGGSMLAEKHPFYTIHVPQYTYEKLGFLNYKHPYDTADLTTLLFEPMATALWHGIMRREPILQKHLLMSWRPDCITYVEFYWILALAMHGPLRFTDSTFFTKHFHPLSLHINWTAKSDRLSGNASAMAIISSYIEESSLSAIDKNELLTLIQNKIRY